MFSGQGKFVLIVLFTALLITLVNLVWWFNFQKTEQLLGEQLGRRLAAVASTAAVSLDGDQIDSLRYGNLETYLEAISILEQVRQSDSLSELFILDENYFYLATTELDPDSIYFLAGINGPQIDSALFGLVDGSCQTPTYQSGSLYLKSAFAPLAGSDGTVRAVLGVEANIDYFDSLTELKQNLYYASGLSLLGGLLLGAFFLWGQRRINDSEQRMFLTETHAHLGRMVAVVAHELRNPLMIIRGSAERLVKKTDLTEAKYVIEEVDRLNEIVSGYLDFAGAGGSLLAADTPVELDLNNLVAATSKHLIEKYPNTQITWLNETPTATVSIVGYERSLRQVLLNLLFNSVEACVDSGRPVEVGVKVQDDGSTVQLTVIDHGPGLTKAEQKKIFTPFYTTRKAGSGLGLYLCRTIIDQMGGSLVLESEPEVGTEIIIRLPKEPKR